MNEFNIQIVAYGGETIRVKGVYRFTMNRNRATITYAKVHQVLTWESVPRLFSEESIIEAVKAELKKSVEACY